MNDDIFRLYAEKKIAAKKLVEEIKDLESEVFMRVGTRKTLKFDFGTFSVQERTTYKYSDKIKEAQAKEQKDGTAKKTTTKSLRFVSTKNV